jgi:hypothetical protein
MGFAHLGAKDLGFEGVSALLAPNRFFQHLQGNLVLTLAMGTDDDGHGVPFLPYGDRSVSGLSQVAVSRRNLVKPWELELFQ